MCKALMLRWAVAAAVVVGGVVYGQTDTVGAVESVKIGTQVWMKKNLNIETERDLPCYDGNPDSCAKRNRIKKIIDKDSWCYENKASNCAKYGRLYNWQSAKATCESIGWRLPDTADWERLVNAVGGYTVAGKKLKAKSGWKWDKEKNRSGNGTDDYGFSALPGGSMEPNEDFYGVGYWGCWWTNTLAEEEEPRTHAYLLCIYRNNDSIVDIDDNENNYSLRRRNRGYYARCIKDN